MSFSKLFLLKARQIDEEKLTLGEGLRPGEDDGPRGRPGPRRPGPGSPRRPGRGPRRGPRRWQPRQPVVVVVVVVLLLVLLHGLLEVEHGVLRRHRREGHPPLRGATGPGAKE